MWPKDVPPALPADTYVLMGHGALYLKTDRRKSLFLVPQGVYVIFWVRDGETLTNAVTLMDLATGSENVGMPQWEGGLALPTRADSHLPIRLSEAPIGHQRQPFNLQKDVQQFQDSDKRPVSGDLPELVRPGQVCINYRLTQEIGDSMLRTARISRGLLDERVILPERDPWDAPDNQRGQHLEKMLLKIRAEHPRQGRDIHVHYAVCRAHVDI